MKKMIRFLLLTLFSTHLFAEQYVESGDYIVHYNAFNSTIVAPTVAQQHGLKRSRFTAMLNIAVFRKMPDGSKEAVSAELTGEAKNLIQQKQVIDFTPIKEGKALYYIGTFTFANEEVKHLSIDVKPTSNVPTIKVRFNQKFYTDAS